MDSITKIENVFKYNPHSGYCINKFRKRFLKINIDFEQCYFNLGENGKITGGNYYLCIRYDHEPRKILRIALPISSRTSPYPLMGIVSTAIAGHWEPTPAATIGALAIGVSIFNSSGTARSCAWEPAG